MTGSARALLAHVVDYAGTFPPARLEVSAAVQLYARYLRGRHAWMLGRLILPLSSLETGIELLRDTEDERPGSWLLSVIVPSDDLSRLQPLEVEARHEGRIRVDSVEVPPGDPSRILEIPHGWGGRETYFEVPLGPGAEERLDAIAVAGAGAKVRMGGLEPRAFPSAEELAGFLLACSERRIPFKATAGLHHPFRSVHRLGEEAGGVEVVMHGFVNLAVAACLLNAEVIGASEVVEVLEERDPAAFVFQDGALGWRGRRMGVSDIEKARRSFFRSFGACSFEEPIEGLVEARVL